MALIHAQTHIPMKTRMRPLVRTMDMSVFDWVPMDVIEMRFEVLFVFQRMLSIPRLPNPTTPLTLATGGHNVIACADLQSSLGKLFLQPTPAFGILAISRRQRPNRMQMVGQQHDGIHRKRPPHHTSSKHAAQDCHRPGIVKQPPTSMHDDGKEKRPARYKCTTIVWHARDSTRSAMLCIMVCGFSPNRRRDASCRACPTTT